MSFSTLLSPQDAPQYSTLTPQEKASYMKEILGNSLPTIAAFLTPTFTTLCSLYFMTKYKDESLLAGYGLGAQFCGAFGQAWIASYNQATNVKISQAFGAKDFEGCGRYFRRNLILLGFFLIPLIIALLVADKFMIFFGVSEELASIGGTFTKLSTLWIAGFTLFDSLKAFAIGQKIFQPILYIQLFTLALHVLWSKLFIDVFQLGVVGAVICKFLEEWANTILLYLYIQKSGKFKQTWGAWTKDLFNVKELWEQFKFGCSIAIITYGQWAYYEVQTLIAGNFDKGQVVVHIAISNVSSWHYCFALAISVTMLTFLGNSLGERKLNKAKNYVWACFTLLGFQTIIYGLIILFGRHKWVQFWTDQASTQEYMLATITVYCCTCLIVDGINNGLMAVLKSVGKEKPTTKAVLASIYLVGVPLVALFAFVFDLKVKGVWIGFGIGALTQLALNFNTFRQIDWKQVQKDVIEKNSQDQKETELTAML